MVNLVGPWPAHQVPGIWDKISPHIDRANQRSGGRYSQVVVFEALLSGQMQLWTIEDETGPVGCVVTEVVTYGTGLQVCSLVVVTGKNRQEWVWTWRQIAAWAKAQGCARIESWARPGWAREMAKHGWFESHRLIEYDLTELFEQEAA
jgi:hypothetical protein